MPECPWEAICPDVDVPRSLAPDVALNAIVRERRDEFSRPDVVDTDLPDPSDVEKNRKRWVYRTTDGSQA